MLEMLEGRVLMSRTWFVSPTGNDQWPGTISQPFKTIQHAALLAFPGDTVYLRAGTYHETVTPFRSGTATAPITYEAYGDEAVTIDGADPITGWTTYSKSIYSAPMSWDLGQGNDQIFVNGAAMNEAAWPNTAVGAVTQATAAVTSVYSSAIGNGWDDADTATIGVANLPGGTDAWAGATIHIGMGQDWVVQTGTVLHSGNGTITYAYEHQTSYETPVVGNHFYLTGKFLGLDAAGEWYLSGGRLYLWTPNGANPATDVVEAKVRQYAFQLAGVSYIDINNLNIVAASIDTNASSDFIKLSNLTVNYVSQQMLNPLGWMNGSGTTGVMLLGHNDQLTGSTINHSSGNGVFVDGYDNLVQDCTISNVDYSGVDDAGITAIGFSQQLVSNVIFNTGRDGMLVSNASALTITSNTIYKVGLDCTDLGAIYTFGTNGGGTVISGNTVYDVSTGGYGAAGVYLDNGSANYIVHNNVITSTQIPLKLNPPSYSNSVYNNYINGKLVANSSSAVGVVGSLPHAYGGKSASFTTLGTLGAFRSSGEAINNAGQIVGTSYNGTGAEGYLYSTGKMTPIAAFNAVQSWAVAINNNGQSTGSAYLPDGQQVTYLDSNGVITSLGTLTGDLNSVPSAINDSGQVVGVSYSRSGVGRAFISTKGIMTPLIGLGGSVSQAKAINNSGNVVGDATVAGDQNAHAVLWSGGKTTDLGTLGGVSSYALAINATNEIVGASLIAGNHAFHAFAYVNGKMKDLGTLPGYTNSVATGINASGEIVGYVYNSDTSASHGFVYRNGVMTDLNTFLPANTGWVIASAVAINNNNQIVGTAATSTQRQEAYLLSILG